ncbi:hypothetical protein LY78DRAFT_661375 [Colletotrichum sublineola]|nr:hypothetical protein LY78DRAFT_661375 [Colletotrichum sublineola]
MKGAKGGEGRVAAFSVICSSTEPYYSGKDKRSEEKTLISFGNLDIAFFDKVQEYMKKHGIQVMLCEQSFYDYEKNEPMTGFMPIYK